MYKGIFDLYYGIKMRLWSPGGPGRPGGGRVSLGGSVDTMDVIGIVNVVRGGMNGWKYNI